MPFYSSVNVGTRLLSSLGDGYTINVSWYQAGHENINNKIAYHIYYSTIKEKVFEEGVKYISIDGYLQANLINLVPGQMYFIAVRPVEYNSNMFDLSQLPIAYDNLRIYPSSILRNDISSTVLLIPLLDVSDFLPNGFIRIGGELINYSSADLLNNNLIVPSFGRGYGNNTAFSHTISGFDGYNMWNSLVTMFVVGESLDFDRIYSCQSRFEYPNYTYTLADGYHQVLKDILSTDLDQVDAENVVFPPYDYSGYHRTDPVQIVNGTCIGSYIGGEQGCIDANGNYHILRGFSLQDQNTQRQELALSVTGKAAVLIRRVQTGITCSCYLASSEHPDDRCPKCYGTKFIFGYEQYFNPRRSDGKIMVRAGATEENLKRYEAGMESEYPLDLWALNVPTIKTRDIIVMFDQYGNEEFRYEVAGVTRNNTVLHLNGGQHFKGIRIRKTDPAYQIRIFRDTSEFPSKLNTSISFVPGIPPHTHEIVINQSIISVAQINQTTAVSKGHNHPVINGVIMEVLGHTHQILLP